MTAMIGTTRARAGGKHAHGPGGRDCACCAEAPRRRRRVRRSVKRAERNAWRRSI